MQNDTSRGEQAKAEETGRQQLEAERLAADLKSAGKRQVLKIAGRRAATSMRRTAETLAWACVFR